MTSRPFLCALKAAGFLTVGGDPAPGLTRPEDPLSVSLRSVFSSDRVALKADAVFRAQNTPTTIFKDAGSRPPTDAEIRSWHEAAWNLSVAPLLWIVTPVDVRLYDCYAAPRSHDDPTVDHTPPLAQFVLDSDEQMRLLDAMCGRLSTETGAFWTNSIGSKIDRRHRVDRTLLNEIRSLEDRLVSIPRDPHFTSAKYDTFYRDFAQSLIGRCIFTWYLLDRGLAQPFFPAHFPTALPALFTSPHMAFELFRWLQDTFNGDLFPMNDPEAERECLCEGHLALLREFVEGRSLVPGQLGQGRLFRFRFNAIPVDLVSSIYQQFARRSAADEAQKQSLHYTPIELVHLVLDPVFEDLSSNARIVDPTCGSGAFLVEAFRRLVWKATDGKSADRRTVRTILYEQLFGIDINKSALGIAAFSLYLAALDFDDEPLENIEDLRFRRLIGTTLFQANTLEGELPKPVTGVSFSAVVGNPPWTFVSDDNSSPPREQEDESTLRPRRSPDHLFLRVAARLAGDLGRIGMIMKATPFFSNDPHALRARSALLKRLAPTALINLSFLRKEELFPEVHGPALLLFARCALTTDADRILVGSIPWTPDFRRTGVFHLGPGEIRAVKLASVARSPPLLKAATFGTVRDGWLMTRLYEEFQQLESQLDSLNIDPEFGRGQGFIVGGEPQKAIPESYYGLRVVTPRDMTPFRIRTERLEPLDRRTLHRPRIRSIFRGPLVLCPKGGQARSAQRGRYGVAVIQEDVLYTQNLYGISFADIKRKYAYVLSGILNSALTTFQLAFGGPTWGLERPTVGPDDLLSLRVPALLECDSAAIEAVMQAEQNCAAAPDDPERLHALDEAVFDLYELEPDERTLARDSVMRARPLIFETHSERARLVGVPDEAAMRAYAGQVVLSVNAFLRARGERHVAATIYPRRLTKGNLTSGVPGMMAVRFVMVEGAPAGTPAIVPGNPADLEALAELLRGRLKADIPPYINERRQLRLYGADDLFILKPHESRYWTPVSALNDADVILADHWLRRQRATAA